MSDRVRSVLRWLDYGGYVTAWTTVPPAERPRARVVREDGEWRAVTT